jgi:hypothetical protein
MDQSQLISKLQIENAELQQKLSAAGSYKIEVERLTKLLSEKDNEISSHAVSISKFESHNSGISVQFEEMKAKLIEYEK